MRSLLESKCQTTHLNKLDRIQFLGSDITKARLLLQLGLGLLKLSLQTKWGIHRLLTALRMLQADKAKKAQLDMRRRSSPVSYLYGVEVHIHSSKRFLLGLHYLLQTRLQHAVRVPLKSCARPC